MALLCPFCRHSLDAALAQQGGGKIICPSCGNQVKTAESSEPAAFIPAPTASAHFEGVTDTLYDQHQPVPLWVRAFSFVADTIWAAVIALFLLVGLLFAFVHAYSLPVYFLIIGVWLWWRFHRLSAPKQK